MKIGVIGAGAFGTALAISLARGEGETLLWTRAADAAEAMRRTGRNAARLPGVDLPEALRVTDDLEETLSAEALLIAVPMQKLRDLVLLHGDALDGRVLVACCKGIELKSLQGPVGVLRELLPRATPAILTGPSFAHDIATGLPTALTLACADAEMGRRLQQGLTTPNLRIYRSEDTLGAELGGALKNVIAIACGAAIGAGLGESARAALMTRGNAEMGRMAAALGARPETLAGLAGFGDLALTCTSEGSRNYRYGLSLGRREAFDPKITVEGAATARAVLRRAQELEVDMPITQAVVALLDQTLEVGQVMTGLLARPLKEE